MDKSRKSRLFYEHKKKSLLKPDIAKEKNLESLIKQNATFKDPASNESFLYMLYMSNLQ